MRRPNTCVQPAGTLMEPSSSLHFFSYICSCITRARCTEGWWQMHR